MTTTGPSATVQQIFECVLIGDYLEEIDDYSGGITDDDLRETVKQFRGYLSPADLAWAKKRLDPRQDVAETAAAYHAATAIAERRRLEMVDAIGLAVEQGYAHVDLGAHAGLSRQSITKIATEHRRAAAMAGDGRPPIAEEPTR